MSLSIKFDHQRQESGGIEGKQFEDVDEKERTAVGCVQEPETVEPIPGGPIDADSNSRVNVKPEKTKNKNKNRNKADGSTVGKSKGKLEGAGGKNGSVKSIEKKQHSNRKHPKDRKQPVKKKVSLEEKSAERVKAKRGAKNGKRGKAAVVAKAVADAEARALGEADALRQMAEEKNGVGAPVEKDHNWWRAMIGNWGGNGRAEWVFDPLAYANMKPSFVIGTHAARWRIDGLFSIAGVKCAVRHSFREYRGEPAVVSSSCLCLVLVERSAPEDRTYLHMLRSRQQELPATSVDGRVRWILRRLVTASNLEAGLQREQLVSRCKSYYFTYFSRAPNVEGIIRQAVDSDWFLDMRNEWVERQYDSWYRQQSMRVRTYHAVRGYTQEDYERKVNMLSHNCIGRTWSKLTGEFPAWTRKLETPIPTWAKFLSVPLLGIPLLLRQTCGRKITPNQVMREMTRQVFATPEVGLMPANKDIHIQRVQVANSMLDTELWDTKVSGDRPEPTQSQVAPVQVIGVMDPNFQVVAPAKSEQCVEAAVRKRMAFDREVNEEIEDEFLAFSKKLLREIFGNHVFDVTTTREQDLEYLRKKYGQKSLPRLTELYDKGVIDHSLVYNLFVKDEVYVGKTPEDFKPRMIWSVPDPVKAKFGNQFKQLSKQMARYFNADNHCYYTSGSTPDKLGKKFERMLIEGMLVESDVSSWDGSMLASMGRLEVYFLETYTRGWNHGFDRLKKNWCNLKGRMGSLEVTLGHGRRSGDHVTSSFNTLINICVSHFAYNKKWGELKGMFLGDDNLLAMSRKTDIPQARRRYSALGMKIGIFVRAAHECTYCSGRFWRVDGRWRWGNLPFKVMSKFGINWGKHGSKKHSRLLYGIAKSMLPTCGHVPVVGAFMRAVVDSAEDNNLTPFYDRRNLNPHRPVGGLVIYPSRETYEQFCQLYDVDLLTVIAAEEYFSCCVTIDMFPAVWSGTLITRGLETEFEKQSQPNDTLQWQPRSSSEEREEREKLKSSFGASLVNAWNFGWDEGHLIQQYSGVDLRLRHAVLHTLFTAVSYCDFASGVSMHQAYNRRATHQANKNKARKKARKNKPGKKKPKRKRGPAKAAVRQIARAMAKEALIAGGAGVGSYLGGPSGGAFGAKAGRWISKISGMGDYHINSNTLFEGQVPKFGSGHHTIRVQHREYLGDIQSTTAFNAVEYPINPGLAGTFPWLSKMSGLYTQYTLRGLIFEFVSTSASALNSTNTALGTVILATRYNPYDPSFTSKIEMDNHEFTTSSKPASSCIHPIECAPDETPFRVHYVRNGGLSNSQDQRLYDWGVFTIATVGMQASSTIGELWVSYDVVFEKPRLNPTAYPNPLHGRIANGPATNLDTLGTVQRGVGGNMELILSVTGSGYDTITLPNYVQAGRFYVQYTWLGGLVSGASFTPLTSCAVATSGWGYGLDTVWQSTAGSGSTSMLDRVIDVTGANASFQLTFSTGTPTSVDVIVMQMPGPEAWPIVAPAVAYQMSEFEQYRQWRRLREEEEQKEEAAPFHFVRR